MIPPRYMLEVSGPNGLGRCPAMGTEHRGALSWPEAVALFCERVERHALSERLRTISCPLTYTVVPVC